MPDPARNGHAHQRRNLGHARHGVWTVANRTTGAFTPTVKTASGTRIAGTPVAGLSAASIPPSTKPNFAETGANTVTAGQLIDVVLTLTGARAGAYLCLNGTRT